MRQMDMIRYFTEKYTFDFKGAVQRVEGSVPAGSYCFCDLQET